MPRRGEVWWVAAGSHRGFGDWQDAAMPDPLYPLYTSPHPAPPLLVPVNRAGRDVVAVTDQIRAVAKERLQERIADISSADLAAVTGVRRILELG